MLKVIFGTAQLFSAAEPRDSAALLSSALLSTAYDRGFRRFDTAPSYGYGESEPAVGALRMAAGHAREQIVVTTKVGIEPARRPGRTVRTAKWAARRLPPQYQQRLRPTRPAGTGRFEPGAVAQSVERSLRRLGRIDRLLLHEVVPEDITEELLTCLNRYRDRDDVGQLGVATANEVTGACLQRAGETFEVVHIAAGPAAAPVSLPGFVTVRVGHGLLGPAGEDLRRLSAVLREDPELAEFWESATAGTRWQGSTGLAELLLASAIDRDLTEVIVATRRPERLASLLALFGTDVAIEGPVLSALSQLVEAVRSAGAGGGRRVGK